MAKADDGRRVRLVYVAPGATFAGVQHVVHEIAGSLVRMYGDVLDVHVVYFSRFPELEKLKPDYTVHCLDDLRMRQALGPLSRLFKALKPDIINVAQCEMTTLCFLAAGFNRSGALFVPHLHGNPGIERASSLRSRMIFAFYDRFVAPAMAGVFAVSQQLAAEARKTISAGRPVYFVPNPVRPYADAATHEVPNGPPHRFVNVARLSHQKGQDVLLRAFPKVRAALPGATLGLVGDGPEGPMLKSLSTELGLDDCVQFHGHQSDPTPYLKAATCFVLPSRWEGFPLAMTEALSFGLPVVATDCAYGPRELVLDRAIGRIVKMEDADAFAGAMVDAAQAGNPPEAVASRRSVVAQFATAQAATAHFQAIRQIARDGGARNRQTCAALIERTA